MAKKFAHVQGLHKIYETYNTQESTGILTHYNLKKLITNDLIDHNTISFVQVETEDVGRDLAGHIIKEKDRFVIVQNDVFALFGSPMEEPKDVEIPDNTWRPIYLNGEIITDYNFETIVEDENGEYVTTFVSPEEPFSINYGTAEDEYVIPAAKYDVNKKILTVKYDFNIEKALDYMQNNLNFPSADFPGIDIPTVNDGKLKFEKSKSTVYTKDPITVENPDYDSSDPNSPETITTNEVLVDENTIDFTVDRSFSANTPYDTTVTINYKGTADRVDWYVTNEARDNRDDNNSKAKKFVYIDCLQKCFEPSSDYPYLIIKEDAKDIISEDSIVFITCGKIIKSTDFGIFEMTDADAFDNPEYMPGARFIWTHGMMFSSNTWMPIFTRETIDSQTLNDITRVIGNTHLGGRLIFQGAGGIKVDNTQNGADVAITIDGTGIARGEGGSSLQDGKATNVTGIVGGVCVNVVAKEGEIKPADYYDKTKKNFIQIKEETNQDGKKESWIEVNGMDAKSIFIDEEIPIGGTVVGDNVIESGSFSDCDNKIPVGMSLHEVLYRILFKEKEEEGPGGDPADIFSQTLKINNKNLNINAWYYDETKANNKGNSISSGSQLPIGTKVIIEIAYSATAEENVTLQFTPYGVETEPELIVGENVRAIETPIIRGAKAYKEVYSPEVECVLTTEINGFNEIEASETPGKNTYIVEITQNGVNTISAINSITASQDSIFERHQIWRLSSFGNRWPDDPNFIAANLLNETDTISRSFTLNALLPYFIGVYRPQTEGSNYFDFESATDEEIKNEIIGNVKDNTGVAVERCGYMRYDEAPTSNVIPFDANNWFGININNKQGPAQLVFVMPKSALNSSATLSNWITLFNALGIDITLQTGAQVKYLFKEISLYNSNDYYLYTTYNPYTGYGKGNGQLQYKINNLK